MVKVRTDLTGNVFGRLTVIKQVEDYVTKSNAHFARWLCQCECGNNCCVVSSNLKFGTTKSCGCLQRENVSKSNLIFKRKANKIEQNGDVTTIFTFKGEKIIIDTDDYPMIKEYCWAIDKRGYAVSSFKGNVIYMHRTIMKPSPDLEVDHINCDKTDNRKSNLRICTHSQNARNRGKKSDNTSGFVGVTYEKRRNKWVARIWNNGKRIHLGEFKDIEDAIKTRKEAEIKYYGEYAYKGE